MKHSSHGWTIDTIHPTFHTLKCTAVDWTALIVTVLYRNNLFLSRQEKSGLVKKPQKAQGWIRKHHEGWGVGEGTWVELMNESIWVCNTQSALPPEAGLPAQPALPAEPAKACYLCPACSPYQPWSPCLVCSPCRACPPSQGCSPCLVWCFLKTSWCFMMISDASWLVLIPPE